MADNKLSYVNYDFTDLVNELTNRLKVNSTWKDAYISGTGQTLIELYSYVANLMLYNLERSFEECFLLTAKKKSSIINLVQLIGYKPKRKTSAIGNVIFQATTALEGDTEVVIGANTVILNDDGIEYITVADATISPSTSIDNQKTTEVQVVQGKLNTQTFTSLGTENQECLINNTSVENNVNVSIFKVYSTSADVDRLWTEVSSFLYSKPDDLHYVLRVNYDETLSVIFGNNVNGKIPTNAEVVYIQYLVSDGLAGNVYELDAITTVQSSTLSYNYRYKLTGVEGPATTELTVTNVTPIIGGDESEDIEEIRIEAPRVFKTGDRLVTKEDFQTFILNTSAVADVNVWGEYDVANPEWDIMNTVKICAINQQWEAFTLQTFTSDVLEDMRLKSMLTVKYDVVDCEQLLICPRISIYVNKGYGLSTTQTKVSNIFDSNFYLGSTAKIGEAKRLSNLVQAVEELAEVAYIYLTLEIQTDLVYDSGTGFTGEMLSTSIKPNTIRVMNGNTQIGVDAEGASSEGTFTGIDGYTVEGTVNYDTGAIEITAYPEGADVYVLYQQDNDGDIIAEKHQICRFNTMNVDTLQYKA